MKRMTYVLVFFLLSFLTFSKNLLAEREAKYTFSNGTCIFHAIGSPGFLKIHGQGAKVTGTALLDGTQKIISAEAQVSLKDFTTGIPRRDEHMHTKYLETAKYPIALLKMNNVVFKDGSIPKTMTASGSLSLHGKTKDVEIHLNFDRTKDQVSVKADFSILLTDFGVDIPSFMSVTVAKDVNIEVELTAVPAA